MNDLTQCVLTPEISTEGFDPLGVGVHRASTIVFKDAVAYASRGDRGHDGYSYGLYGTPTTRTLEAKLTKLEGEPGAFLDAFRPSRKCAVGSAVPGSERSYTHCGQRLIRQCAIFAETDLKRLGVRFEFFDPSIA
jgi:cystathionine beta-lyase